MAVTRVGELVFEVDADGRILERSIRRIGRRAGLVGGQEAGESFNASFGDSLSNVGEDVLNKLRARSRRKGAQAGTITGRTFSDSVERAIRGRLNGISDLIARVFAFNGNEEFERWRKGFDTVGDAADSMAEKLDFARDEGRLTAEQYDKLRVQLDQYTDSAHKVEEADARMLLNRRLLREETTKLNTIMSNNQSFERYVQQSGSLDKALDSLRRRMAQVNAAGDDDSWSIRMGNRLDNLTDAFKRNSQAADDHEKTFARHGRLIKSHVGRTIAAWTALVLAIGEGTASLGSGLGAGLTAIIGSLAVGLTGALAMAGSAVAGFGVQITLAVAALQKMKDVVPGMQGALDKLTAAWESAGTTVAELWGPSVITFLETITGILNNPALLAGMGNSLASITNSFDAMLKGPGFTQLITALETTIPEALSALGAGFASIVGGLSSVFAAASPALLEFAGQFNTFWTDWAARMAEATSDGSLQRFFDLALDSLNAFLGVVGSLGSALSTLFQEAAPYGNYLLGVIEDLLDEWNTWMQSIEGQQQLQEWFALGTLVMQAMFDLLGQLGQALGSLVTPESIGRLLTFLDGLGQFLPIGAQILEFFGRLNILNLFVTILNTIGALLTPMMPVLLEFATIIGETLIEGVEKLAPHFERLGTILAPVMEKFAVLAEVLLPVVIDIIIAVIDVVISIIDTFTIFDQAIGDNEDALKIWGDILGGIFQVVGGIIIAFLTISSGVFKTIAALLRGDFTGAFKAMEGMVRGVFDALGLDFDEFIGWVADMVGAVSKGVGTATREFKNFGRDVGKVIDGIIGFIRGAIDWFGSLFGAASKAKGATNGIGGGSGAARPMASGGVLYQPRRILAGEAGPEAIVPLRRNLSMVDPSVRWLSALAQGRAMASGGVVGAPGKTVNVAPGAIVVQEAQDGHKSANDVLTRLIEYAGS